MVRGLKGCNGICSLTMEGMSETEIWVREQVTHILGPEGAEQWLGKPNEHLDGRSPLDVLRTGDAEQVRKYVQALVDGAYL